MVWDAKNPHPQQKCPLEGYDPGEVLTKPSKGGWAGKICLCCKCLTVSKCTPSNDFYVTEQYKDRFLCESCFREYCYKIIKERNK
jgi:hypothetical protein